MVKPKITLLDFLHLNKEDDTAAGVMEEDVPGEGEVGEEEEKAKTHTRIYSVWEITRYIRQKLDSDELLRDIYVKGELSNVCLLYTSPSPRD